MKGKELQKVTGKVEVSIKKDSTEKTGQWKSRASTKWTGNEKGGESEQRQRPCAWKKHELRVTVGMCESGVSPECFSERVK